MLTPHRRHLATCDAAEKGWNYTLCSCPIYCDGRLHGRRYKKSLGTGNWDRALRRIQILEAGGELAPEVPEAPTLERAVASFLQDCRDRNLRPSTIESYSRTFDHLKKGLGERQVSAIDTAALSAYRARRKMAPGTWRKELEHLRAFFAFCHDRGWNPKNPAKKVKMPRTEDLTTLPFTPDEVTKLLKACDEISSDDPARTPYIRRRARALVYTLLYSGLRVGDVAALARAALNEKTGHLTLRIIQKTRVPLKVQLRPDAVQSLLALPAQNPEYFFWTGGAPVTRCAKNIRRTIQRLGTLASVDDAHPHRFRDTFAVELLSNGADIRTVQLLLGHKSVKTTERHYAHFISAHQAILDRATATLDFSPKARRPLLVDTSKHRRRNG